MDADPLDHITIKGFKSIVSLENLALRPINVLIGANGSGKSNFIRVFGLLQAISDNRLEHFVAISGGADKLLHFGSRTTREIELSITCGSEFSFHIRLEAGEGDSLVTTEENVGTPAGQIVFNRSPSKPIQTMLLEGFGNQFVSWRVYHFHDTGDLSPMKKTSQVDDNRELRPDGSNLASFLFYLRKRQQASYDLIVKTIQRVAPFFLDFRLEPLQLKPDDIKLEWRHRNSDEYFGASALSDGTLRFIALTTLFLQPLEHRPSLILVDEPELGLHPYAIGLLASMIKQAAVDTQVIVSTQSSLLLDYFEPEDVLVADCVDGATQLKRLDRESLSEWLEEYSLGQLWEKNEIGGLPGSM